MSSIVNAKQQQKKIDFHVVLFNSCCIYPHRAAEIIFTFPNIRDERKKVLRSAHIIRGLLSSEKCVLGFGFEGLREEVNHRAGPTPHRI